VVGRVHPACARRDDVIRAADAAGISIQRIYEITGIARTVIMRIPESPPRPTRQIRAGSRELAAISA